MLQSQTSPNMHVSQINAFKDNYIWAICAQNNDHIALVDPGDATVCIEYLTKHKKKLSDILITHHHPDHVGGIEKLVSYCAENQWPLTIYGPSKENIPSCDVKLEDLDTITLESLGFTFTIFDVPGHTLGHIAYLSEGNLFCGDTLFSAGCGRLFEGTAQQMYHSLSKLARLPENTNIYCAHEYTLANVNFALAVDPNNMDLIKYFNHVNICKTKNIATIPSTIKQEKLINPFIRCHHPDIIHAANEYNGGKINDPVDVFATIRLWKDHF